MSIKTQLEQADDKVKELEQQLPWWRRFGRYGTRSFLAYQVGHCTTWLKADLLGYGIFKQHLAVIAFKQLWVHVVAVSAAAVAVVHELASPV
jgi:hypothetical protein